MPRNRRKKFEQPFAAPIDTGNAEAVSAHNERVGNYQDQENQDVITVASTPGGRAFIWRLLGVSGVQASSYQGTMDGMTEFREGKRAIGMWVIKVLDEADPNLYVLMQQEAIQRALIAKASMGSRDTNPAEEDEYDD